MVEFEKDGIMKLKAYSFDCAIEENKYWPIIVIIYNKYIFFTNNRV